MSLSSSNHRKSSDMASFQKNKFTTKHSKTENGTQNKSEAHEHMNAVKKSNVPVSMDIDDKSGAERSLCANVQEKGSYTRIDFHT
jgi:hypothetical protein